MAFVELIEIEKIDPNPWQTRASEDPGHIRELADDILNVDGLLQIPIGRMDTLNGRVQLAFGHSRLAAFKLLCAEGHDRFSHFPVNLHDLTDEQMAVYAFTENEKRRNLNPVERAGAINRMIRDFGWTQQLVADKLTIDRSSVANALRLLDLPVGIQKLISDGTMPVRSAMALLPYYELTPLEIGALQQAKPDYEDFLTLAWSGQVNSDTIRAKVGEWMDLLHPKPLELPLVEETESSASSDQALSEEEEPEPSESDDEDDVDIEADSGTWSAEEEETQRPQPSPQPLSQEERSGVQRPQPSPILGEEEEQSAHASPSREERSGVQRSQVEREKAPVERPAEVRASTPPQVPAPAPAPVISLDRVVTFRWFEAGGVSIAVQHPGEIMPRFSFKTTLTAAEIPELLEGMGIE